ncbi:hypothetical protein [Sphingomonas sp.]|uniref:hypothetical protein n=1 Tax=Sphingomonas sp. TaxID=28214 RepID=UPI003BA98F7D
MGKNRHGESFVKTACRTIGGLLRTERTIKASCMACKRAHPFTPDQLQAMLDAHGPDYRLCGRRYRCSSCQGWMRLHYQEGGMWWPLWDDADVLRWSDKDRRS